MRFGLFLFYKIDAMNEYRQDNTLAIVSLVLGGLGFFLSIIPCIGFLSIPLAVIGLILGAIAFFKAKDNGDKTTLSIVALVISFLPILISIIWYFAFTSGLGNIDKRYESIQSCSEMKVEIEKINVEISTLEEELENDGSKVFGNISRVTSLAIQLEKMQDRAESLGCNIYDNNGVISIDSAESNIIIQEPEER
ncbi:MAG: hypothetical protein ACI9P5_003890 [Saprospiraceae bacterium]